jgi:Zn-dependent alcohol dehydrogenase
MQNCSPIIVVDCYEARLELAAALGATHTINTSSETLDITTEVKSLTNGSGPTVTIDATGFLPLIKAGLGFTANTGKMIILGVPPLDANLDLNVVKFMTTGKSIVGSMEGDAVAAQVRSPSQSYCFEVVANL